MLRVRSETGMRDRNGGSRFPACIPASGPTFCELGTVLSKGQRDADDAAKHWPFARWAAVLCVFVLAVGSGAQARELSTMDGDEIKGLQQRLTDASCYAGPLDGTASNMLAAAKAACPDQEPVSCGSRPGCMWRRSGRSASMRAAISRPRGRTTRPCGFGRCRTAD